MEIPGNTFYLLYHFVTNEQSSNTKVRVVCDGACGTSTGTSLNNCMLAGATVQDDLFDILLRFRVDQLAIRADIAKMFRQIFLIPEQRDLHRILWRDNKHHRIKDYRLKTVTYDTALATFLSSRYLLQLADEVKDVYAQAALTLRTSMYVDDLKHCVGSREHAKELFMQLQKATETVILQLRKRCSNDQSFLMTIPDSLQETSIQDFDEEQSVKALGVQWIPGKEICLPFHVFSLTWKDQ